jgi:CheY-like chemotaxis protein
MSTTEQAVETVHILLVEDNPADVRLTREVLSEGRIANRLHSVGDGEQAMDFLRKRNTFASSPRPQLILLDLNLPRKDGREVLAEIKSDPDLRTIPVVVLTTSRSDRDILESYNLHANCYISKPVDLLQFMDVIRSIEGFWLTVVRQPSVH